MYSKPAFDANFETIFTYLYQGNQQFNNRFIITDTSNNSVVYNELQTTFKLEHKLPENTLINGKSYTAEVIVYDINNFPSDTSAKVQFKTFTTPEFYIGNLVNGQIVRASSYELNIVYEQPEGELLNEYQITLYDLSHNIINSSGYLYPADTMIYTLYSLLDNQGYYLKLTGVTVNKTILDLPEIEFSVKYVMPALYSKLKITNLSLQASTKIESNLIMVDGKPSSEPVVYIDDEKVDLSGDKWLEYDSGFNIENDFAIQIVVENIARNRTFFEMTDKSGTNAIIVQKWFGHFYDYDDTKEYFILHSSNGVSTYRTVSNFLDVLEPTDQVNITIKRINNLYSITASAVDLYVNEGEI